MSDQDNATMFDGTDQSSAQEPTNQVPQFLQDWVGEGKKYSNLEDALKSIPAAQAHIEKLETEAKTSRLTEEQQKERETQLMADLEQKLLLQMQQTPASASEPTTVQPKDDNSGGVDIDEVVRRQLSAREAELQAERNQKSVVAAAINKWGSEAQAKLYGQAAELGMSQRQLDAFAAENPKAVYRMLGIEATNAQPTNTGMNFNSTLNTQSGVQDIKPMPNMPESFDQWGSDDYLVNHIRQMEQHLISTGEIPDPNKQ